MVKILLVEDNRDIQFVLSCRLGMMGFAVIHADNGKEGVEKAVEEGPDLILMDILMPCMDGKEATRLIRSNPHTRGIPVIALTALTGGMNVESIIEAGCNDYISKPFSSKELQEKILKLTQPFAPSDHISIHS